MEISKLKPAEKLAGMRGNSEERGILGRAADVRVGEDEGPGGNLGPELTIKD